MHQQPTGTIQQPRFSHYVIQHDSAITLQQLHDWRFSVLVKLFVEGSDLFKKTGAALRRR